LHLSLTLAIKAKAVEGETKSAAYHQRNQSTHDWWRDSDVSFC